MGDFFFFANSSSFNCFHTLFFPSPKPHAISSTPNPKRRMTNHMLPKSISHSQSNNNFDIISSTEHCDGSVLFRFGIPQAEKLTATHVQVDKFGEVEEEKVSGELVEKECEANDDSSAFEGDSDNGVSEITTQSASSEAQTHESSKDNVDIQVMQDNTKSTPLGPDPFHNHETTLNTLEEQIIMGDELNSNIEEVSVASAVDFKSIGTISKREEISTTGFCLSSGATLLSHPSKALTGGGDAYFVACQNWLGIADGVGQWSLKGINPGLYAQELMENCEKIVLGSKNIPITNPVEVLNRSAVETQFPGTSTVLVAYFDGQALHVANIGDSGFIILRNGSVLERSSPLVHEFNFPVQIERGDDPSALVEEYKIDLDEDDVIVTATDGLFDNLYEQEIASTVSRSLEDGFRPQEIAESLAMRAQEVAESGSARSPFADAAQAAGYIGYRGGKLDDVTVIVSLVEKKS